MLDISKFKSMMKQKYLDHRGKKKKKNKQTEELKKSIKSKIKKKE